MLVFGDRRSTPSTVIEPLDGSSSRLQQRRSVDLPEPDGPIIKDQLLGQDGQIDTLQDLSGAE